MNRGAEVFGSVVRRRGLSHAQVARELDVSSAYVCRLLSGARKPSLALAARIEARFGVEVILWHRAPKAGAARRAA